MEPLGGGCMDGGVLLTYRGTAADVRVRVHVGVGYPKDVRVSVRVRVAGILGVRNSIW